MQTESAIRRQSSKGGTMNLYEIDEAIQNCFDEETGEIFQPERLNNLEMEREKKVENIALWIKELAAESEALKREKLAFAERQRAAENKAASLKRYLTGYLDGEKFKSVRVAVSFRKTEQVQVEEGTFLPDEYIRYKEPEVDKTALKAALKAGQVIEGASLVQNTSIIIK